MACPSGAANGTSVEPSAVACRAIPLTVRSRYWASYSSMPCCTEAVPCFHRLESSRASVWAVAVLAFGAPNRAIRMKLSINSRCQFDGFVLLAQALTQYLCGGLSSSRRLCS